MLLCWCCYTFIGDESNKDIYNDDDIDKVCVDLCIYRGVGGDVNVNNVYEEEVHDTQKEVDFGGYGVDEVHMIMLVNMYKMLTMILIKIFMMLLM